MEPERPTDTYTAEQANDIARAARISELRDCARLFREVLDTPRGRLVLAALEAKFQTRSGHPPNILDQQGRTDALQTWRKLGHFDVIAYIKLQITNLELEHVNTRSGST